MRDVINNAIANITDDELKREIWTTAMGRDNDDNTPLMIAVKKRKSETVKPL